MVMYASEESGLEELQRLSREIEDKVKELALDLGQARESVEQVEKKRLLWSVIRDLKISMVLEKLEPLAEFDIFNEVSALKSSQSTAGLRRVILKIVDELDKSIDLKEAFLIDVPAVKKKLKILNILMELLFYID